MSEEIAGMEFQTRPGKIYSSALAWATLLDSATVSFDAHPDWSKEWVEISFRRLDDDGNLLDIDSRTRNASQAAHADEHEGWLKLLGYTSVQSAAQVWREKEDRFPGLHFLPRVEKDLVALGGSGIPFQQAILSLASLAKDVDAWKVESPWPEFSSKASPEAETRQDLCWVMDDSTGKKELFDWHIRFTGGLAGRIHFRVDSANKRLIIAYIGGKLNRKISN
ncbi:hypothetical protein [Delftia sp. CH05]|uniref:hypothetical protein n=1 Tax=Delftia sp. CH05 TaxID=2692194 RepID=UPI00135DCAD7|nr:hypothetical protein [Delftia sp. CH05]MXN31567.1 hypothetical protein [Delftia sp. CH05]